LAEIKNIKLNTRAKVSAGWNRDKNVLVRGAKGTNLLAIINVRRKLLRGVFIQTDV